MVEVHVCLRVLNTKKKEKYEGRRSTMKHATSHAQLLLCTGEEENSGMKFFLLEGSNRNVVANDSLAHAHAMRILDLFESSKILEFLEIEVLNSIPPLILPLPRFSPSLSP